MRNNLNKILIACIIFVVSVVSCKKMDDNYRDFITKNQKIYVGKADSIIIRGGENKAEVSFLLLSDPKINSYKVYWNSRQDSIESSVVKTDHVDTVRVMIDDMTEGTHHFEIITFDKYGNSSVPSYASGVVYGSQYQETLLNRTYLTFEREGQSLIIKWTPPEETMTGVEMEYVNRNGELETHSMPAIVESYILPNFPPNGSFKYRTLFLPDTLALDVFHTNYATVNVNDSELLGRKISFNVGTKYGTQPDQLSVLISIDFNGVYDVENVNAATWIDVSNKFEIPIENDNNIQWGPFDITEYTLSGESVYVAFRYTYDPDKGTGKTWYVRNFLLTNLNDIPIGDLPFRMVQTGPFEEGRWSITPTTITLRANKNYKTDVPNDLWAISDPI